MQRRCASETAALAGAPARGDGVDVLQVPGGPVASTVHAGAYDELPLAYGAVLTWCHERGHRPAGPIRETYLAAQAAAPVTRVSVPLA